MANAVGSTDNIKVYEAGYPTQGTVSIPLVASGHQILLHSFSAYNASGSSCDIGLASTVPAPNYSIYTGPLTAPPLDSAAPYTVFDTTAGDGLLLVCSRRFGYVTFNLTQAQTGSPTYAYEYWNGSAWTALSLNQTPAWTATGLVHVVFNSPADWVIGDGGTGPNNGYAIRLRSVVAGTQQVITSSIRVARWFAYRKSVTALGQLEVSFSTRPILLGATEAIVPYYQTANSSNSIEASYQQMG